MRFIVSMLLLLILLPNMIPCLASEAKLDEIGFGSVEELAASLEISEIDIRKIALTIMKGEYDLSNVSLENVFTSILNAIKHSLFDVTKRLAAPILASALLHVLIGEKSGNNRALQMLCRITCMLLMIKIFIESRETAEQLVDLTIRIANILSPVMISAITLTGAAVSASILSPIAALAAEIMSEFLGNIGIGLSGCAIGLAAAECVSDFFSVKRLFEFIKGALIWSIGIMMVIFIGILSVQGLLGASHDSVAVRGARYAVENTVPIIGGEVSDTMDSMLSSVVLLKNAVGITGLILLLSVCFKPILEIAAMMVSIKIAAAVSEPVSDGELIKGISRIGETYEMLLASCLGCVMMVILLLGAFLMSAGNMVR